MLWARARRAAASAALRVSVAGACLLAYLQWDSTAGSFAVSVDGAISTLELGRAPEQHASASSGSSRCLFIGGVGVPPCSTRTQSSSQLIRKDHKHLFEGSMAQVWVSLC